MDTQLLREKIRTLLAELERGGATDADLKENLHALDRELHALLVQPNGEATHEEKNLDDRLREISIEFAGRHPRLEPILAELTNMLASIGI